MFALCYRDLNSTWGQLSLEKALKPPSSSHHVLKGFCCVGFSFKKSSAKPALSFVQVGLISDGVRSTAKSDNPVVRFSAFPRAAWLCSSRRHSVITRAVKCP